MIETTFTQQKANIHKSFKTNNSPDSEEISQHSAENAGRESVSETDSERELSESEQNHRHLADNLTNKPDRADGGRKKLRKTRRQKHEIKLLSQTLQLDRKNHMYIPLTFNKIECQGLLDTGAVQSAMSEAELAKIFKIQIANGSVVPIRKQVLLRFDIAGTNYEETFMILPQMSSGLIGITFFTNYSVIIDVVNYLIHLQEISL